VLAAGVLFAFPTERARRDDPVREVVRLAAGVAMLSNSGDGLDATLLAFLCGYERRVGSVVDCCNTENKRRRG
jgi:hypothetical protein